VMTAGLWASIRTLQRGRTRYAGLLLGLASTLKLFPLVLVLLLVAGRRRLASVVAIATVAAATAATAAWVWALWPEYLGSVLFAKASSPTTNPGSQSISAAVLRTFTQNPSQRSLADIPTAAHILGIVIAVSVLAAVLVLASRLSRQNAPLGWAITMAVLPLTMPHAWQHYYILALPLLWMVAAAGWERRDAWLLASAGTAYLCLSLVALTIDHWLGVIAQAAPAFAGLYINGSVIGATALLLGGVRLASPSRRSIAYPTTSQPLQRAASG
jgi:alpha-1,2-mannosyltransferase